MSLYTFQHNLPIWLQLPPDLGRDSRTVQTFFPERREQHDWKVRGRTLITQPQAPGLVAAFQSRAKSSPTTYT